MSDLLGSLGSDNRLTVDNLDILAELIADLEGCDVGVDGERTYNCHVIGGHSLGQSLPAGEGVTLLGRLGDCRQPGAVLNLGLVVGLAIHSIGQLVLVDRIASRYRDVMRRHRLRELLPPGKGVSDLLGSLGSDNRLTVDYLDILAELIADLEGGHIGIDGERTCDSNVICGHRGRQSLPAGEGVTLFDRLVYGRQGGAVLYLELVVRLSINGISQLVLIDRIAA